MAGIALAIIILVLAELLYITQGQQGLTLTLRGRSIAAGSNLSITNVGENALGDAALICTTTISACCTTAVSGEGRRGNWKFPNYSTIGGPPQSGDFYVTRTDQRQVLLQRRNNALEPLGMYCCEVETVSTVQRICVNIVEPTSPQLTVMLSGSGSQRVGESYTLTCTASGGGSGTFTYQWHVNRTLLIPQSLPSSYTFSHLKEMNSGRYTCTVTKDSMSVTSKYVAINVAVPDFTAVITTTGQPVEGQNYMLTCAIRGVNELPVTTIEYQWDSGASINISQSAVLVFSPLTRDINGNQYNCTVTITSPYLTGRHFRSTIETISFSLFRPELEVTQRTPTTLTLAWTIAQDVMLQGFRLVYNYTIQNCAAPLVGNATTLSFNSSVRSHALQNLSENSTYMITLTVINSQGQSMTSITTHTNTTRASRGPSNVRVTSAVTSISIQWDEVDCAERNGVVTGYNIRYGLSSDSASTRNINTTSTRMHNITGLLIRNNYSFEVAAINSHGIGVYSSVVTNSTTVPNSLGFYLRGELYPNNSIVNMANIGVGRYALHCITDRVQCCRGQDGNASGDWYQPGQTTAVTGDENADFNRTEGPSAVLLNRQNNATDPTGLYRCQVLDSEGLNKSVYIGIYGDSGGIPRLSSNSLIYLRRNRTLICASSGGPVTSVTWMKGNALLSSSSPAFLQSKRVINTVESTYHNVLTIDSTDIRDYTGEFTCRVANRRGNSSVSTTISSINITGNKLYQIRERTRITCSVPINVISIQWINMSDTTVVEQSNIKELDLDIVITEASNNTMYRCTVRDGHGFIASENITIIVGVEGLPCIPNMVVAVPTRTTITISWSCNALNNETFTVRYRSASGIIDSASTDQILSQDMLNFIVTLSSPPLQPGIFYYYQIYSSNTLSNRSDIERIIKTMDDQSSEVTSLSVQSSSNTSLLIHWQPPITPNGVILNYTVRITLYSVGTQVIEENTTDVTYTASGLSPGVPYNVSVIPVNLAGQGLVNSTTTFTKELKPNISTSIIVKRTSPTTMVVSWRPLTLSEARGFVTYYSIAYIPTPNSRTSQDTMYANASADSSSVTIEDLDEDLAYIVTVAAATRAGIGTPSESVVTEVTEASMRSQVEVAAGAALGLIVVIILTCILIVIILKYQQSKKKKFSVEGKKNSGLFVNSKEAEAMQEESEMYESTSFIVKDHLRVIPVDEFGEHVQRMHADRDKWFEQEFNSISKQPLSAFDVATIQENKDRNRFGNIYPYDYNRVILKKLPEEKNSDYINASHVEGYQKTHYIAAQGPTDNALEDFWRMIWEYKVPTLVMLTRIYEGRKKCETYWPESADEEFIPCSGSLLTIKYKSMLPFAEFVIRKMVVTHSDKPNTLPLEVTQFHYLAWPDHGVPSNAFSMINFIKRVRKAHPYSKQDTLLVHCSAGVGRTGTFITLDSIMERIKTEKTTNIYEFVINLRKQRVLMVQTVSQYVFIHNAIQELITCGETEITAANMRVAMRKLSLVPSGEIENGFKAQLNVLNQVTSEIKIADLSSATCESNASKNRYQDKIPYNHSRVQLKPTAVPGSDYINASFVDGYRQKNTYIATQGPLSHTVNDFWRMIWEKEVKCIVMLCKNTEKGNEVCHHCWPQGGNESKSEVYGKYTVTLTSQDIGCYYITRKLKITERESRMSVSEGGFTVTQFQYLRWPEEDLPQSTTGVLEVANLVQKVQMGSGNKPIVVMCNDGVGRTGAFIATHAEMERMKAETVIDLFQFIKGARLQRAGLVSTKEQYEFCHQVVADFIDSFDTYANFKEII